jgi:hypothetical protein
MSTSSSSSYQQIRTLREVLHVETERVAATVYRRDADGWSALTIGARDRSRLQTVGLDVALADLYRGLPWLPP